MRIGLPQCFVYGLLFPIVCEGFLLLKAPAPWKLIRDGDPSSDSIILPEVRCIAKSARAMSSEVDNNHNNMPDDMSNRMPGEDLSSKLWQMLQEELESWKKLPPFRVDDMNLLYYDVFLIVNLALSISFWVTHRLDFSCLPAAFNEGSLMSLLWIAAGLYNGAFLHSAKDGNYDVADEQGGPKAAGLLGFVTFLGAINLRLIFALVIATIHHRPFGSTVEEELLPLEIGFGLALMTVFRFIHSSITPRI